MIFKNLLLRKNKQSLTKRPTTYLTQLTTKYSARAKILFSQALSKYERKLSLRQKKLFFSAIAILMTALSTYYLYRGLFIRHTKPPFYLQHQTISPPQDIALPDSLNIEQLRQQKTQRDKISQDTIHP